MGQSLLNQVFHLKGIPTPPFKCGEVEFYVHRHPDLKGGYDAFCHPATLASLFGVPQGSIYYRIEPYKVEVNHFSNSKSPGMKNAKHFTTKIFMSTKHLVALARDVLPTVTAAHIRDLLNRLDEMVMKEFAPFHGPPAREMEKGTRSKKLKNDDHVAIPMLPPQGGCCQEEKRRRRQRGRRRGHCSKGGGTLD